MFSYEEYDDEEFSVSPYHKGRGYYFLPKNYPSLPSTEEKVKLEESSNSNSESLNLILKEHQFEREENLIKEAQLQVEVAELKAQLAKERLEKITKDSSGRVDHMVDQINPRELIQDEALL